MLDTTYVPPPCYGVCIEIFGHPSELVLGSGVVSSHGGYLVMVLLQRERYTFWNCCWWRLLRVF